MLDSLVDRGRRKRLVEQLSERFEFNIDVLEAINSIPRHLFIEKGLEHLAYQDRALPIAAKQTISQPYTVAMQSHLLKERVGRFEKVLEIGTGCGYQTAILAKMGYRVYSIERFKSLYLQGQKNLAKMGLDSPLLFHGDGFEGLTQFAPFKGILISCGAPEIPQKLLEQLEIGGRMVLPLGRVDQTMVAIDRISQGEFRESEHGEYKFVPMLRGRVEE